jgi:hypothetical protein
MEFAHRNFTGICCNLSYRPPILDPYSQGVNERQGELTGNSDRLQVCRKSHNPMRNNGKTSVIDSEGYISSFDVILFPMVWSWASHDRHID